MLPQVSVVDEEEARDLMVSNHPWPDSLVAKANVGPFMLASDCGPRL